MRLTNLRGLAANRSPTNRSKSFRKASGSRCSSPVPAWPARCLLVLDEPCAGMDPGVRERFLAWLDERVTNDKQAPTTVLVTHHIEEIVPGIQNTLILSGGRVHSAGRTREVITREAIETVYKTRLARIEQSGGRLWPLWGT